MRYNFVPMYASCIAALVLSGILTAAPSLVGAQGTPSPAIGETRRDDDAERWSGRNEIGIWTGYSPFSFKLKGVTEGRQLFLLNLQYARRLLITSPLTLKY